MKEHKFKDSKPRKKRCVTSSISICKSNLFGDNHTKKN